MPSDPTRSDGPGRPKVVQVTTDPDTFTSAVHDPASVATDTIAGFVPDPDSQADAYIEDDELGEPQLEDDDDGT